MTVQYSALPYESSCKTFGVAVHLTHDQRRIRSEEEEKGKEADVAEDSRRGSNRRRQLRAQRAVPTEYRALFWGAVCLRGEWLG